MFALDGKTFSIKNLLVNFEREFKTQDMSGQSCNTDDAEQGEKAAKLSVTGLISFTDIEQLKTLEAMSAAKTETGDRKIYRVVDDLANAFKIREVKFSGRFSAEQQSDVMAWQVSFSLREHKSAAEQKEQHQKTKTKATQSQNTRLKQSLMQNKEAIQ
ncbi:baseplate complex protein [Vibrio quintilis]|uniref:Uncharacterized protein n=1 Tax=Vibrio quintilis TaxID=1117707 RepID=A0A1M7YZA7_9VIBR|nr:DNA-binding protein [Vibrio quintilis]SHO57903.1 hypothetical protein VQ7734_03673 [Vibrio quintilis]